MIDLPNSETAPVLYSFRRCPYAMRARMALAASEQVCELRDILLRDRPDELYAVSPKGTVPVLVLSSGEVIEESLDVMRWALGRKDPQAWLPEHVEELDVMLDLIAECDGDFKKNLDGYKYASQGDITKQDEHRVLGSLFLLKLEARLGKVRYLFGADARIADIAIFPFVRQFAFADKAWFDSMNWPRLQAWLEGFLTSERFLAIMKKGPVWEADAEPVLTRWAE